MNIVNDDVLCSILASKHSDVSSIRILDRRIDDNVETAGVNYTALVCRLIIRYHLKGPNEEDKNDTPIREKKLFLKVPSSGPLYEVIKKYGCYAKEVEMYTQVLPQMYAIEEDEYFTPRQYYFDDKMTLVLQDLSQSGYKCADRVQQLDFEHCFYAFRCLAKFHALSVEVERTCGLPESVKSDIFMEHSANIFSQIPQFIDVLPQRLKDLYPELVAHLAKLSSPENLIKMADFWSSDTSAFEVLNHGDFRINNIMFKYDKYGTIKKVKLIDFQLTTWASPVRDLIFFTISSMKFEVYEKYFPLLVKIYLDTLNRALRRLNCPPYEISSFLDDLDNTYDFGLLTLSGLLPLFIPDPDDLVDTNDMCKNDKMEMNAVSKIYRQKHFQKIAFKWFEYFGQKGTLRIDEKMVHEVIC